MFDADATRPNSSLHPMPTPVVTMQRVNKYYQGLAGQVHILRNVNLTIKSGEFVGVTGPSGSGKSTLVNMITGIDHPSEGTVTVANQSIHQLSENHLAKFRGRHIGVVFQFFQLLPTLTALENVMMPMDFCNQWNPRERRPRAMELLSQVNMADHAHKLPSMLSGGQQQRVAVARALANDPLLVIGDEPTGNLDRHSAGDVFELLSSLTTRGKTVIIVTHDIGLVRLIPRIIEVQDGVAYEGLPHRSSFDHESRRG